MPNGGVPMYMILYPKDGSPYVLYCKGGEMRLYDRNVWEREKVDGTPLCTFTEAEGAAIAWFLKYWLGEHALQPGYNMRGTVNAEFDF
jgi:hypothetical protein